MRWDEGEGLGVGGRVAGRVVGGGDTNLILKKKTVSVIVSLQKPL